MKTFFITQLFLFLALISLSPALFASSNCQSLYHSTPKAASQFKIARLNPTYTKELVSKIHKQFAYDPSVPAYKTVDKHIGKLSVKQTPGDEYFVAVGPNNEVLGGIGLYRAEAYGEKGIWIDWFFVERNTRGSGIGRALLQHAFDIAEKLREKNILLYTSNFTEEAAAQILYAKFGFKEIQRIRDEGKFDDIYGFPIFTLVLKYSKP